MKIKQHFKYISNLMDFDRELLLHGKRTAVYAVTLANNAPQLFEKYSKSEALDVLQAIYDAGFLHDLGKIMYSERLLYSKEKLTPTEKKIMEQHPVRADEMLACTEYFTEQNETYQMIVRNGCLYHHEKWDGTGYPYGLSKTDIPLESRLISLADIFDALTARRSYKGAWSFEEAIEYLTRMLKDSGENRLLIVLERSRVQLEKLYRTVNEGNQYGDEEY